MNLTNFSDEEMRDMSGRRKARELALCSLYAFELSENPLEQIRQEVIEESSVNPDVKSFAFLLLKKTVDHLEELDNFIRAKTLNWDFERIAVIDKLILRLAICEFLYFPDIPPKVSIDEAIEISKKYSTEKSGKFVNGILDSILSDLRKSHRLHKQGRGLIE